MFGTLGVNSVLKSMEKPPYYVRYNGQEWIKFNYDTGAGATALPVALAGGLPLHRVEEFVVANGQDIPNFGRAKLQTMDEFGNKHKIEGHITEMHKPLASASEISKHHDAFIFEELRSTDSSTQSSCRRSTTRVSSIVQASRSSWNSTSVSGTTIEQLLHETCRKIGDGTSGRESGHRDESTREHFFIFVGKPPAGSEAVRPERGASDGGACAHRETATTA